MAWYPSKDRIENAYWRTLVGNKLTLLAGNVDEPPEFWQNAYNVWHELLWQKEGVLPRFFHVRGLRRKEGFSAINKKDRALSEDLRSYFSGLDAEQQKIGLDEQLRASGVRAVLSAAIEMSQDPVFAPDTVVHSMSAVPQGISPFKPTMALDDRVTRHKIHANHESKLVVTQRNKPEGFEPLPAETIDEIAGWVRRYPNIQPEEKDRLMEIISPLADNNAQKEEPVERVRAKAHQAFQCDFLRVARNRKFCTTKKRYMG
ncbi:MAG: hypothetical protein Q9185_007183 [Variospora sp. 1 TL-2023]